MARLDIGTAFTTAYGMNHYTWPSTEVLYLPKSVFSDTVIKFDILPYRDTGGTLLVSLNLTDAALTDLRNFTILACLNVGQGSRFDVSPRLDFCISRLIKNFKGSFDPVFFVCLYFPVD